MILNTLIIIRKPYHTPVLTKEWMFNMLYSSTETEISSHEIPDDRQCRRSTDLVQPLDYVTKGLVDEFIEHQQQVSAQTGSFIQRLFEED